MLNIIIIFEKYNTYEDILNYIKHINNINKNTISINIYILNCNNKYNISSNLDKNIFNNINVFIYTYNINYTDSILNDIISNVSYDYILFTKFDVYLTYDFIEWLNLNTIDDNCFIRNNIFNLNNISDKFFNLYDNDIYYNIIENMNELVNENGINIINNIDFIEKFNNETHMKIFNTENIQKKSLYYLHNSSDFIIVHKNIVKKEGFNIENNNKNLTYQYFILNLINNNYDMHILPFKISSYKLKINNINSDLINIKNSFICNTTFNKHINYKIYNLKYNKEQSYIRDQIKSYRGYNPTKTITENNFLKNENKELNNINLKYKNKLEHNINKINFYFRLQWYNIYKKYNKLNIILNNTRNKTISIFKMLDL